MSPIFVCLVALLILLVAERWNWPGVRAIAKLSASSAFVWAALEWGAADTSYGQFLLSGFVLCWLGDALLLPAGKNRFFELGIGAFMLAHVAYSVAFIRLGMDLNVLLAGAVIMGFAAWGLARWLRPHLAPPLDRLVLVYIGVISVMVVVALAAVAGGGAIIAGVGALGFALSDIFVARDRFVSRGFVNSALGLPAYFLSQLALAYSVSQVG